MKTIDVTATLTSDEFVDFGLHQSARGPKKLISPTYIGVEIILFALLAIYLFSEFDPSYALQLSAISLGILILIYATVVITPFYMTRSALRDNFKKSKSGGKEMRFSFTETGFIYRADGNETVRSWEEIHKVTETDDILGIFTTKSNVYLIPKRAFENDDFRELREIIYNAVDNKKLNFL